jgi:uncharacterized protein (TIGR03067 family)
MSQFTVLTIALAFATSILSQDAKSTAGTEVLQGTWVITTINGQPLEGSPETSLTFTGDKYYQSIGADVNERGTIKLDTSKKPMTIDLIIAEGDDAGKTQLGVFEVTGDTLRANLDHPGANQRPSDFTATSDGISFVATRKK